MTVPVTKLHAKRIMDQIHQNLIGLQRDIHQNAKTHLAMAKAQNPPIPVLQGFISDCMTEYTRRLGFVNDRIHQSVSLPAEWTSSDITDVSHYLTLAIERFNGLKITDYASVIKACESLAEEVNAPDSLWPE